MEQTTFPLIGMARLRMGIDGSGITTLVAGAGCPLRCKWCIRHYNAGRGSGLPAPV